MINKNHSYNKIKVMIKHEFNLAVLLIVFCYLVVTVLLSIFIGYFISLWKFVEYIIITL
jgi:hypothetical protein